jgi:hypothetical protein
MAKKNKSVAVNPSPFKIPETHIDLHEACTPVCIALRRQIVARLPKEHLQLRVNIMNRGQLMQYADPTITSPTLPAEDDGCDMPVAFTTVTL